MNYDLLDVWRPDGSIDKIKIIASQEDHLGNLVAEGLLSQAHYYPELVKYYSARARGSEREFAEFKWRLEGQKYADSWVERYLDFQYGGCQ